MVNVPGEHASLSQPIPYRDDSRSSIAWLRFHKQVCAQGGIVLEDKWLGKGNGHRILCKEGHLSAPRPGDVREGAGICRSCAGKDPKDSRRKFEKRLDALGFKQLDTEWIDSRTPFRVQCPEGHEVSPRPGNVLNGTYPCHVCSKKSRWDVFYIVLTEDRSQFKFGITSDSGKRRLGDHRRAGYPIVRTLFTGLSENTALGLEREVKETLKLAQETPLYGREYYSGDLLGIVLDVVENYPGLRVVSSG
jgi:hypothetical protein